MSPDMKEIRKPPKPRKKLAWAMAIAIAIASREYTQRIPEVELGGIDSSYFRGEGHVLNGKDVYFLKYDKLPSEYRRVLDNTHLDQYPGLSGKGLYESKKFDTQLRSALLNLLTKADETPVRNDMASSDKNGSRLRIFGTETIHDALLDILVVAGAYKPPALNRNNESTVLNHIVSIYRVDQDRLFAITDGKLAKMVAGSGTLFHSEMKIDDAMHAADDAFIIIGNVKTWDERGSLQMVFSTNGKTQRAEVDIDKWQDGPEHLFREICYNHLSGQLTDPAEVWAILVVKQNIVPPYRIVDASVRSSPPPSLARLGY